MKLKTIYWKRFKFNETGYELIEIREDGTLLHKRLKRSDDTGLYYSLTNEDKYQLSGSINIEQLDFKDQKYIKKTEITQHQKVLKSYPLTAWKEAREDVYKLQKDTENDLTVDVHSVMNIELDTVPEALQNLLDHHVFPIVKYRFNYNESTFSRTALTSFQTVEFSPVLNEKLYFHYIPENKYLTMSGDNLFALHTEYSKTPINDLGFTNYVQERLADIQKNKRYYKTLIIAQRERRAMFETDTIGDLYPR